MATNSAVIRQGTAGNDIFQISGSDTRIWGGSGGYDTLVLSGNAADYSVRDNGDGTIELRDLRIVNADGTAIVRDIDFFQFADGGRTLADLMALAVNVVLGSAGADDLQGSIGRDSFTGGAGDDRIWGGSGGTDTAVYSGRMSDYAISSNGDGSYRIADLRGGVGDGVDTVRGIEQFQFTNGTVSLETMLAGAGALTAQVVSGTAAADELLGSAGDDVLIGKGGSDHIWGGTGGNDTAVFTGRLTDYSIVANGNGSFTVTDLRGGTPDGIDVVRGIELFRFADQTASLEAFQAATLANSVRLINGTIGADILSGGIGNEVFLAKAGNDRIWGGKGGDDAASFGGKFSDYVVTDNGNGAFTVVDIRAGSADGTDVVRDIDSFRFSDRVVAVADVLEGNQQIARQITGGADDDVLTGADTNGMTGAHTNDMLTGNQGSDILRGGAGHDLLVGDWLGAAPPSVGASTVPISTTTDLGNVKIGLTTTGTVTFMGETAGFRNALGCYKIDASGNIYGVKILFANASQTGSGGSLVPGQSSVDLDLVAGDKLAFFVVSNGFDQSGNAALLSDKSGSFKFVGTGGAIGNIGSGTELKLVHVSATGQQTVIKSQYGTSIFHSLPGAQGTLNGDRFVHVTGVTQVADGSVKLGFEDLWGGGDKDFDDCVFKLQVGAANAALLSTTTTLSGSGDGAGIDQLFGGLGDDTLMGGAGNDVLEGGLGADALIGGAGSDAADYSRAASAVVVDLASRGVAGEAAGDTYDGIERVEGSRFADIIRGDAGINSLGGRLGDDLLEGRGGNDVLRGGDGADTLDGGAGRDTASYFEAADGVVVDLSQGIGTGGIAAGDRLVSIEVVQGSNIGADVLIGSSVDDELQGFGGNDTLEGGDGNDTLGGGSGADSINGGSGNDAIVGGAGSDSIDGGDGDDDIQLAGDGDVASGGAGTDIASYAKATAAVSVDLSAGTGSIGAQATDSLSGFEFVVGSSFADTLAGDDDANTLSGRIGNDTLSGRGGNDKLNGEAGDDVLIGGAGYDVISGGEGYDRAVFSDVYSAYVLDQLNSGAWRVTHEDGLGADGLDIVLANVEELVFADGTLIIGTASFGTQSNAYDYLHPGL